MGWWVSITDLVNLWPPVTFLFKISVASSLCLFRFFCASVDMENWSACSDNGSSLHSVSGLKVGSSIDILLARANEAKAFFFLCLWERSHVSLSLSIFLGICKNAGGWIHGSTPERNVKSSDSSCVNWTVSWDRALLSFSHSTLKRGCCKVIGKHVQSGNSPEGIHIFLC